MDRTLITCIHRQPSGGAVIVSCTTRRATQQEQQHQNTEDGYMWLVFETSFKKNKLSWVQQYTLFFLTNKNSFYNAERFLEKTVIPESARQYNTKFSFLKQKTYSAEIQSHEQRNTCSENDWRIYMKVVTVRLLKFI